MLKNLKPWDLNTVNLINNLLGNDNSLFIDCGANYGAYSIPISKKKPNATIICFDPSKSALSELKNNIQLNKSKNIKYYDYGISDKISKAFFSDNISNFNNSGEYSFNIKIYKKIVIKLDVEGYEFKALVGMKNLLLNKDVIIFFEFSRMLLRKKTFNFKKLKKFMDFYKLYLLDLNFNLINIKDILYKFSKLEKKKYNWRLYFS